MKIATLELPASQPPTSEIDVNLLTPKHGPQRRRVARYRVDAIGQLRRAGRNVRGSARVRPRVAAIVRAHDPFDRVGRRPPVLSRSSEESSVGSKGDVVASTELIETGLAAPRPGNARVRFGPDLARVHALNRSGRACGYTHAAAQIRPLHPPAESRALRGGCLQGTD